MKLKSISIHGFKSFADRVALSYHDGITGVIGPNGSGKSNIIDAVRWVMGEQTAKSLRADDPTDIIFAGSQNRKPLSLAEVTLTFNNTGQGCPPELMHLPEISIGRRIYRDGEREYFFNKQPCRLKDIVEFLMSIGLGAKSYSIIQQEKRDRIIQASPEDMREILEETAGISAFKQHRKDAEKRLLSASEHLKNLANIENELVKQSETLKEQVEKASLKMKLVTELRDKEIKLLANNVGHYSTIARAIENEINTKSKEEEKSFVDAGEWESKANFLKAEQLELATEIKDIEREYDDRRGLQIQYSERESHQRKRNDERASQKLHLSKELTEERQNLQREEERMAASLKDLENAEIELRKIDGELETIAARLDEVDETMLVERQRGEELRSEINAIDSLLNTLRVRNDTLLQSIQKINDALQRDEDYIKEAQAKRTQLVADRRDIETQLSSLSKGLETVASEKSSLDMSVGELNDQLAAAIQKRDEAKGEYLETLSHTNSLEKIISANEGLSDGARTLRENLSNRIQGFLFENVTVHKDDEALLERAVPELLQSALVENLETLIDLLDRVEEIGMSRVGFVVEELLPALSAEEEKTKAAILATTGIRCVGARAIKPKTAAIKNLLDRVFIARDEWLLLKAYRLATASAQNFIFISERGTVLSTNREISFGENKDGAGHGLLQRKRELEALVIKRDELQGVLASTEGQVVTINSRKKELETRLSTLDAQLSTEKTEVIKLSSQLDGFDLQIKHIDDNIKRLENDKDLKVTERDAAKTQFGSNQAQIDKNESDKTRLVRDLEDFEAEFSEKRELKETLQTQLQSRRTERATTAQSQDFVRQSYEQGRQYLTRTQAKVDKIISSLTDIEMQIANADKEEQNLTRELEQIAIDVAALSKKLDEAVNKEAQISEELRVIEGRLKNQRDADLKRQKYLGEKQAELAQISVVLQTMEKDLWEKFSLKPEELPKLESFSADDVKKLEREIKRLTNEIQELGAVNELAVNEYESVEERRAFLTSQKADIEKSILELQTAIAEIEETTRSRFKETYELVNAEFQKLFPVLFPGGSAELHLLKPDDMLNTGVEILVKLPGKRQQNMSLFSGGEKALTAISLIFAFLKTRPAPFCFLDEVDAPLDEANVGRFNAVIEALSDQFQFVVITHNRRTMEVLDRIYGISMSEPGVSKFVSVDLSEVPAHLRKKEKPRLAATDERPGASASG